MKSAAFDTLSARTVFLSTWLLLASTACGGGAQQASSDLVISSDATLGELAAALLPDLAARSGLSLRAPVRLEMRSREQLVRYLESKLDEELPPEEARATVDAYALLGLVSADLDLRCQSAVPICGPNMWF